MDDHDIREGLRASDRAVLGLVLERHGAAMYDAAFKIARNHAMAEDAVQDALLLVWRYRARVAEVASFRNYVVEMARNCARDRIRTAGRRRNLEEANAAALEPEANLAEVRLERAVREALADCVARLEDDRTRRAVLMRIQEEQAWAEIAEALAPPLEDVDAIRMRVKRALRALRTCMAAKGVTL